MIVLFSGTLLQYMEVAVACISIAIQGCVRAGVADSVAVADSAAVANTADPYSPSPASWNHAGSVNQGYKPFSTACLRTRAFDIDPRHSRPG